MKSELRSLGITLLFSVLMLSTGIAGAQVPNKETSQNQQKISQAIQIAKNKQQSESVENGGKGWLELGSKEDGDQAPFSKVLQGLAICLGSFLVIVYFLKKKESLGLLAQKNSSFKLLDKMQLANRVCLHLVEVEGQRVLVGSSPDQLSLIALKGSYHSTGSNENESFEELCVEAGNQSA